MGIQVEVCVQNCFSEQEEANSDENIERKAEPLTQISDQQWQDWFGQWLDQLQPNLSPIGAYELSLRLTNDREIQTLNAQYRQQDKPTDVLAFAALEADSPASEVAEVDPLYLGDIIISIETAERQAIAQGHDLKTELVWLASHGLLHLLGWDHPDEPSLIEMLSQQKALLNQVHLEAWNFP